MKKKKKKKKKNEKKTQKKEFYKILNKLKCLTLKAYK